MVSSCLMPRRRQVGQPQRLAVGGGSQQLATRMLNKLSGKDFEYAYRRLESEDSVDLPFAERRTLMQPKSTDGKADRP